MNIDDDAIIICAAADERRTSRILAAVRRGLGLHEPRSEEGGAGFIWRPGRLQQRVATSLPFDIDGVEHTRVTSRIPALREVSADPADVEHILASLNHFAHRSCYVFNPETRSIDAVQSMLVSEPEHDSTLPVFVTSCQLQFLYTLFHRGRLQSQVGGREADDEWPVEAPFDRPFEAADALRLALIKPEPGGNPFADRFELEVIAEQVNEMNAFSAGATADGLVIDCPFDRTTALLGLKTNEPHPIVGEGLLAYIKLPIFGEERELARLVAWLNRKEAAGEIPSDQSGAWTVRKQGDTHCVSHVEFLPKRVHRQGLALHTARALVRKIRLVNGLLNPGVAERKVLEVLEERMRMTQGRAPARSTLPERASH